MNRSVPAWSTVVTMVAFPLLPPRGRARRVASTVVVGALAATTLERVASRWGATRAAAATTSIAPLTAAVERVGAATGRPFGRYAYTGALRPSWRGVPIVVPAAWLAMAVPARETAHAALGARSSRSTRIAAGAAAMTAWDLFLDPQMVAEGYWRWLRPGRYRGIPLSNFAGWFATSLAVMAVLELVLPVDDEPAVPGLVAEYAGMAAMETVGFVAFFRDRLVAAVGGAAMLPPAAVALVRLRRS